MKPSSNIINHKMCPRIEQEAWLVVHV